MNETMEIASCKLRVEALQKLMCTLHVDFSDSLSNLTSHERS